MKKFLIIFFSIAILLIVLALVFHNVFRVQDAATEQKAMASVAKENTVFKQESQEVYSFVSDYLESLKYFKTAQEKLAQVQANAKNYKDDIEMGVEFMNSFKLANKDLSAAKDLLEKHKNSGNQNLQRANKIAEMAYNRLMELNDASGDLLTTVMDKQGHFNLGKYMRETTTISTEQTGAFEALNHVSGLIAQLLVDQSRGQSGLNYLVLTASQRKELVNLIDRLFGEAAKKSKADQSNLYAPAATLRDILAGEYRSADESDRIN